MNLDSHQADLVADRSELHTEEATVLVVITESASDISFTSSSEDGVVRPEEYSEEHSEGLAGRTEETVIQCGSVGWREVGDQSWSESSWLKSLFTYNIFRLMKRAAGSMLLVRRVKCKSKVLNRPVAKRSSVTLVGGAHRNCGTLILDMAFMALDALSQFVTSAGTCFDDHSC